MLVGLGVIIIVIITQRSCAPAIGNYIVWLIRVRTNASQSSITSSLAVFPCGIRCWCGSLVRLSGEKMEVCTSGASHSGNGSHGA